MSMESSLNVKALDLGASDAEADRRLGEYFVTTPFVEEALSGRRTLFLGRKGSGKSALYKQLPVLIKEAGRTVEVVSITPDNYAWNVLRDYTERGLSQLAAHRNAWKLTRVIQIASALVGLNYPPHCYAEDAASVRREFLDQTFGEPKRRNEIALSRNSASVFCEGASTGTI